MQDAASPPPTGPATLPQSDSKQLLVLEAALLCSQQPMSEAKLLEVFAGEASLTEIRGMLIQLQQAWQGRGLALVQVTDGWRFQSCAFVRDYLCRLEPERAPGYSRATMETLAIIAWRQPVTRSDIEAIRGVAVSPQIVQTLHERGWIEVLGHRDAPGRPALLGTTKRFLDDLGLQALGDLPELDVGDAIDALDAAVNPKALGV